MGWLPTLIGHRGSAATAPENTLAGIRAAHAAGAQAVELDVKLSRDGVAMLMHDDRLERTTNGVGRVVDADWATLKGLDAGYTARFGDQFAGEPIPDLKSVLALLVDLGLGANLEIKPCPGRERETAAATVAAVEAHWPAGLVPPVLSSFQRVCLEVAQALAPGLPRGYLVEELGADWQAEAKALQCVSVHPGRKALTQAHARAVVAAGFELVIWTVNDVDEAVLWRRTGASAIITDDPVRLAPALGVTAEGRTDA